MKCLMNERVDLPTICGAYKTISLRSLPKMKI